MKVLNDTPLPHQVFLWRSGRGIRHCSVLVKATCVLRTGALAPSQEPLAISDVLTPVGAVDRPADIVPTRTGTSVVLRASICAPANREAREVLARVSIGPLEKRVVAFGKRVWEKRGSEYVPSEPDPFREISATMNHAFGGGPPTTSANPMGMGFVAEDQRPTGHVLPFLEDPNAFIRSPDDRPGPAAFDAVPPTVPPRALRIGTYDEKWQTERAPLLPDDFDERYFDVAQDSLVARPGLRGREQISLDGLHPEGPIVAAVPRIALRIDVGRRRELPCLDLVVIEPRADRISLTYRQTYDASNYALSFPRVTIRLLERLPAWAAHG